MDLRYLEDKKRVIKILAKVKRERDLYWKLFVLSSILNIMFAYVILYT